MEQYKEKVNRKKRNIKTISSTVEPKLIHVLPQKGILPTARVVRGNNLKRYFSQYCETSTIHGVKYVGERGRHILERLMWTAVVITLFSFCSLMSYAAYMKWVISPITVTFATTEMPIYKIPFPAVTVCPEVKFRPEKLSYAKILEDRRLQNSIYFEVSHVVCRQKQLDQSWRGSITPGLDVHSTLHDLTPEFDPLNVTFVKWLNKTENWRDALNLIYTSEGMCFTFNMSPYTDVLRMSAQYNDTFTTTKWSPDKGFQSETNFHAFPRRTFMSGVDGGLTIGSLYTNNSQIHGLCENVLQGFKVMLHHPCELPNMENYFRVPLNSSLFVSVKPLMISVSSELLRYSSKVRNCYFEDEKRLSIFKIYTQQNCVDECITNATKRDCKCIPFQYPQVEKVFPICDRSKDQCLKRTKLRFYKGNYSRQCDCLPSCTTLSYDVETSHTEWIWERSPQYYGKNMSLNNTSLSILNVYFKDLQFFNYERKELNDFMTFFSNTGGLLGLFLGFSLISAIELVYYLTLRIVCNIKSYGIKEWAGR